MLIRHTLNYLPAQFLSPVAQLVSMILWTYWLVPGDMGLFTLVTATQEIVFTACIGWFSLYTLRYLPAEDDGEGRRRFLETENVVVIFGLAGAVVAAGVTAWSLDDGQTFWMAALIVWLYFVTRAGNMHYAERARAQAAFLAYNILQIAGPLGGLGLGLLAFRYFQASPLVLLAAYGVAQALGMLLALPMLGLSSRLLRPDRDLLRAAVAFGVPMLGLGGLGWIAENYIRYLVQWTSGAAALGLMVVGWSLGRRCASVAAMLVATAAFPIASRLLNAGKRTEALAQLRINAILMLIVQLPVVVALDRLGPMLIDLTVAADYRKITAELLGVAVFSGVLRNLHLHVTDQLMTLEFRVDSLAIIGGFEIVTCLVASFVGLHGFGLSGAIIGQAVGSALTLLLGIWLVRVRQGFIWPWLDTGRVIVATALMGAALAALNDGGGWQGLVTGVVVGLLSYALALALVFIGEVRRFVSARR